MDPDAAEFARLATELHEQPDVQQTVETVLAWGIGAVGADCGSVMLLRPGHQVEIAGSTDATAAAADRLQVELDQGPCVSAALDQDNYLIADTRTDPRWADWSTTVADRFGIRTVLSTMLGTRTDRVGAVNLYATHPDAFDHDDVAIGAILARHASIALATTHTELHLEQTIDAHSIVGLAQGILMERLGLDPDHAFAVLRRYSQDHNLKLRAVAQHFIDTPNTALHRLPPHNHPDRPPT